jgi:copper chaperone CopZ
VGKAALEGLPGVKKVTSGFRGFREINTVTYDPATIHPDRMVSALKQAGTYIGTAEP